VRLEITRIEGLRNDLLLRLDRTEIETALLSVANRRRLMALPGISRHREPTPVEVQGIDASRVPLEQHLQRLGIVDASGKPARRAVAITNRNLGTNHGHIAWQREESPQIFKIQEDPLDRVSYSCLCAWRDGSLSIDDLRVDVPNGRVYSAGGDREVTADLEWATAGQRILCGGHVARVEDIAHHFYDIRHVLAFDHHREAGEAIRRGLYRDYPASFQANIRKAWSESGVPRARYAHNAIGLSSTEAIIVQREGTIEEIGTALSLVGATDGIILDNGGSIACWAWWVNAYAGGIVSPTVDYRPPGTSVIAFILKGPRNIDLPGGSVSYSLT
jgi:hypothetical protein